MTVGVVDRLSRHRCLTPDEEDSDGKKKGKKEKRGRVAAGRR